jgi:hypothetical protein
MIYANVDENIVKSVLIYASINVNSVKILMFNINICIISVKIFIIDVNIDANSVNGRARFKKHKHKQLSAAPLKSRHFALPTSFTMLIRDKHSCLL